MRSFMIYVCLVMDQECSVLYVTMCFLVKSIKLVIT